MTTAKPLDPRLKAVLTYGPLPFLPIFYRLFRDQTVTFGGQTYSGFIIAGVLFAAVLVVSIVALWRLSGKISPMNSVTLVVVLFLVGLTVWFNDARFIKMKPTLVYLFFAGALGIGLLQGKSYLKWVLEDVFPLAPEGWAILTRRFALFFFFMAILNEIVWRNFSDWTWIMFKVVGITVAMLVFVVSQSRVLSRYGLDEPRDPG